jgi:hypothetical protein
LGCGGGVSARDFLSRRTFFGHPARSLAVAIKALQVEGGSEFAAEFEQACQQKELPLFVLPPKLNGHVE